MKKILLLLGILPLLFLIFNSNRGPVYRPELFYLGGIQIHEADQEQWVQNLQAAKMNTVHVTVYAKQGRWDSDSLRIDTPETRLLEEIRTAKAANMHVVLILRVALDSTFQSNKFIWHGMILPMGPEKLRRWFDRYEAFVLQWARIAEQEGVDILGIGSELNALASTISIQRMPSLYTYYKNLEARKQYEARADKYRDSLDKEDLWVRDFENYTSLKRYLSDRQKTHFDWVQWVTFSEDKNPIAKMNKRRRQILKEWTGVIKATRAVYNGKLTYAANFDNYQDVAFWEQLDFIGINAYFKLRDAGATTSDTTVLKRTLKQGWQSVFAEINTYRKANQLSKMPLLFTELGYIRRAGATIEPWAGFGFSVVGSRSNERLIRWKKEPLDLQERCLAINALYEVVREDYINLEGLLYWKLTSHDYHIPYEPFILHLTPNAEDPLQTSLGRFASLDD